MRFDEIFLAKTQDDIKNAPKVLPSEIATRYPLMEKRKGWYMKREQLMRMNNRKGVQIDWAAQIKAGGFMMYPLYLLGLLALVIALQRLLTSREGRLAPKGLRKTVSECLAQGDLKGAIAACDKYPSHIRKFAAFYFRACESRKRSCQSDSW